MTLVVIILKKTSYPDQLAYLYFVMNKQWRTVPHSLWALVHSEPCVRCSNPNWNWEKFVPNEEVTSVQSFHDCYRKMFDFAFKVSITFHFTSETVCKQRLRVYAERKSAWYYICQNLYFVVQSYLRIKMKKLTSETTK